MFTHTDIKMFEDVCRPLVKHNTINPELFDIALKAVKNHIKGTQDAKGAPTVSFTRQAEAYLTRSEVAKMIKCCEKQVDRLRQQGKLSYSKCGRKVLIPLDVVERYVSSNIVTKSSEESAENHKGEAA